MLPPVSVIIPVRNDPANLALCLESLDRSDYPDYEILVVDDGSTDETAEVARRQAVRLLRLPSSRGPAAARNHGARHARHPYLFFLDADVCVAPETLRRGVEGLLRDQQVAAVYGSYDSEPGAPGAVSQYRNLMHHYVHQTSNEEAFTFWSGCGLIKREVFLEIGGFDTDYAIPSIEDIELGGRLRRAGHRIRIVKDFQAKHMKRWTLASMIRCDVFQRGVPWTRLLLTQGGMPDDMNVSRSQRLSVVLAFALVATLAVGFWLLDPLAVALVLLLLGLGIVLLNLPFYRFLARVRTPLFLLPSIPLHVLYFLYSGVAFGFGAAAYLRARRQETRRL